MARKSDRPMTNPMNDVVSARKEKEATREDARGDRDAMAEAGSDGSSADAEVKSMGVPSTAASQRRNMARGSREPRTGGGGEGGREMRSEAAGVAVGVTGAGAPVTDERGREQ